MGVTVKATKKISPKDKSKTKAKMSDVVSVRTDGKEITSISRRKNVSHNKKHK